MTNIKAYTFACILYKDSEIYDYNAIINYITANYDNYAYIEHRPDIDSKKEHTHLLMNFKNKRYLNSISDELGLPSNYIEKANLIPYLRYLIHFDDEDKIQYSIDDVIGPLKQKLIDNINSSGVSESDQVLLICEFIHNYKDYLTTMNVLDFVLNNGVYSSFRRNYSLFRDLIIEHNKFI